MPASRSVAVDFSCFDLGQIGTAGSDVVDCVSEAFLLFGAPGSGRRALLPTSHYFAWRLPIFRDELMARHWAS